VLAAMDRTGACPAKVSLSDQQVYPYRAEDAGIVAAVVAASVGDVGEPGAAEGAGDQVADGGGCWSGGAEPAD
jgi:hypothetical protein